MAYAGKVVESPDTRLVFLKTAADTDGRLLRFEQVVQRDHAPVPAHIHPRQEERFRVLSGRMGVESGGRGQVLEAGEEISVPPGTPHTFWNAGDGELRHTVELRPALKSEEFFETIFGLQRDGRLVAGRPPNPLMMAPVVVEHGNWLAGPPVFLQRLVFPVLAGLGRLFGHKASYPEYINDRKDPEMKQKQALLTAVGGPEVLEVVERGVPEPDSGEVRVKVLASGVAFADVLMRRGKYPGVPKPPFTPGYDVVGEVEELGAGVSGVGTRVAALTQIGGNAQSVVVPAEELVPVPDGVDAAEAASLTLNYVTAYQMLYRVAKVEPGERVLVHGAAGGVGTAMLQLGRLQGLETYGTASSGKHDLVSGLGATPIDYKAEDFVQRTMSLTGDGVDAVFDPIGGGHLARSWRTLRRGGRLVGYGAASTIDTGGLATAGILAGTLGRITLWNALPNGKKAGFYAILSFKKRHPEAFKEDLSLLLGLLAEGSIEPVIAERLPLEGVARAHELMESAGVRGKILLLPNG